MMIPIYSTSESDEMASLKMAPTNIYEIHLKLKRQKCCTGTTFNYGFKNNVRFTRCFSLPNLVSMYEEKHVEFFDKKLTEQTCCRKIFMKNLGKGNSCETLFVWYYSTTLLDQNWVIN